MKSHHVVALELSHVAHLNYANIFFHTAGFLFLKSMFITFKSSCIQI